MQHQEETWHKWL